MLILSGLILFFILIRVHGLNFSLVHAAVRDDRMTEVNQFISGLERLAPKHGGDSEAGIMRQGRRSLKPVSFDPNTVKEDELLQMGLSEFVAGNIIRYREAAGRFAQPEDLSKIYGLGTEEFKMLKPYVVIGNSSDRTLKVEASSISYGKMDDAFVVEINSADSEEFRRINGIGPTLAGRIIKYRNLLGGFSAVSQLSEVYGMSDSVIRMNENHFHVDTSGIRKLSISKAGYSTLLRHPYIEKDIVDAMMKYREFSKEQVIMSEFIHSGVIPDSILSRILPYLDK